MKSHAIPFQNRWANGAHAWPWHCELEPLGVPATRTMYCEHEAHHRDECSVVFDIPPRFVHDWLAFHDRRDARQQLVWRESIVALWAVAASGLVFSALK
ncbi:hypothetical protein [Bradyrhizobium sp. ORS 111]|uniref:hypothetical protein n=1 Tax=Bradyrhizobium sp. ORS 111 TaxID=1685958 RepID=UPI00388F55ED